MKIEVSSLRDLSLLMSFLWPFEWSQVCSIQIFISCLNNILVIISLGVGLEPGAKYQMAGLWLTDSEARVGSMLRTGTRL